MKKSLNCEILKKHVLKDCRGKVCSFQPIFCYRRFESGPNRNQQITFSGKSYKILNAEKLIENSDSTIS